MTLEDVKTLMETMAKTGLTCFDWEYAGSSLHLERQMSNYSTDTLDLTGQHVTNPTDMAASDRFNQKSGITESRTDVNRNANSSANSEGHSEDLPAEEKLEDKPGTLIKSPVVGIYFSAPSPDSDPFITVGSKIESGTTLCIIEAMKLMNEVTSSFDGEIAEILVENGQRVEFGQTLFRII